MFNFPKNFMFGVSNAAHQVEDELDDTWMDFAREGKVRCFQEQACAQDRIRFWTDPEKELDLAQALGVQVFRLSLSWERLVPRSGEWNEEAANHYLKILNEIKARGMKVMLTLFHHAVPKWFQAQGGWGNSSSVEAFHWYGKKSWEQFSSLVDIWITLNEPVPWSYLTYAEGLFPPGKKGYIWHHFKALKHMRQAHTQFYQMVNKRSQVGIAHHMGWHRGRGWFNHLFSFLSDYLTHWSFISPLATSMDFFGINYYGAEWMTPQGPAQYEDLDFSDAGRAICPQGLIYLLKKIHLRFPHLPIFITENGTGDETDLMRPAYLIEHLIAVHAAINEGIPIQGYVHWTLSDNLEWSDGYGPKFGLVEVDRKNNLARHPRGSFFLYQQIIQQRGISLEQRAEAWNQYEKTQGNARPYWRSSNGKSGLDKAVMRKIPIQDWRIQIEP